VRVAAKPHEPAINRAMMQPDQLDASVAVAGYEAGRQGVAGLSAHSVSLLPRLRLATRCPIN
jgi:hypothetical protein